mgnify:CR=1 FL=1
MKRTILRMAKLIAWGVIEAIAYTLRHPWVIVTILIAICIIKLSHSISLSIVNN